MADMARNRRYDDFVSRPIGVLSAPGSSRGDVGEIAGAPAMPSFYELQRKAEPQPPPTPCADVPAGWYPDPAHRHQQRFWDGSSWTGNVADAGTVALDELPLGA